MDDEKLVRDLIPEIAPERRYRFADAEEMPALLKAKLIEEADEVATAHTEREQAAELADVLEVVYALVALYGLTPSQLDGMRSLKALARGGFTQRVVLLKEDSDDWCPCGHAVGSEMTRCIAGRVYGPCSSDVCGGVCEFEGDCPSADCRCKKEEEM